jgi:pyruvate dehydrogenase E1 component alpha subunit
VKGFLNMPRSEKKSFHVSWLQILDEGGNCDEELRPDVTHDQVKKFYEWMVLIRVFDRKALNLQREGRIGTYAPVVGQEAAQVGSAFALRPTDWMFPAFREAGVYLVRGLPMRMVLQYWTGDERGGKIPEDQRNFTVGIPVGTQIPHAVGAAWAAKLRKDPVAVMVYFGDGATSKGDFHEGLNFAGVFRVPIVFLCQNNQWAISVPLTQQTASATLAQKAIAYGFEGIQVDGNDVFAVYQATREALDHARSGGGPTLIECLTYRVGDHTTADDAGRYRSPQEVEAWKKKDPIERLKKYMIKIGIWDESYEQRLLTDAQEQVESAVKEMETLPPPDPRDIFLYTFRDLPPDLKEKMEQFLSEQ